MFDAGFVATTNAGRGRQVAAGAHALLRRRQHRHHPRQ
jgi:hypothetical protein